MNIIALVAIALASIVDLKKREVPDILSYGLIVIGFLLAILSFSLVKILESVFGFLVAFIIGYSMYKTRQWGGGDAKLLMGLGSLLGMSWKTISFFPILLVNIIIAGAVYGIFWLIGLYIKNFKKANLVLKKELSKRKKERILVLVSSLLFILIAVFSQFTLLFSGLAILILFSFYGLLLSKIIEDITFYKKIKPSELTEGDWIVEDIKIGKEKISKNNPGLTKKQISLLKKRGKKVLIKEGIPFVPSFLLGYIIALVFGDWFWISF